MRRVRGSVVALSGALLASRPRGIRRRARADRQVLAAHDGRGGRPARAICGRSRPAAAASARRPGASARNGWRAAGSRPSYYGSPMPHSIFFHKGYAIHGTYHISRLGGPASHGCVRLHPGNAATLFMLVRRYGMANTTIADLGATPACRQAPRSATRTAIDGGYSITISPTMPSSAWVLPSFDDAAAQIGRRARPRPARTTIRRRGPDRPRSRGSRP